MDKHLLRQQIIDNISAIGLYCPEAVELLMGTCAQESRLGYYRKQLGGGPALGIMQMEPATFQDIYNNYLRFRLELADKIKKTAGVEFFIAADLEHNDTLAICFARIHYLRVKEPIPQTLKGWSEYWKKYYNSRSGKGKPEEYVQNYEKLCI